MRSCRFTGSVENKSSLYFVPAGSRNDVVGSTWGAMWWYAPLISRRCAEMANTSNGKNGNRL
jgi:hypothetical protein